MFSPSARLSELDRLTGKNDEKQTRLGLVSRYLPDAFFSHTVPIFHYLGAPTSLLQKPGTTRTTHFLHNTDSSYHAYLRPTNTADHGQVQQKRVQEEAQAKGF